MIVGLACLALTDFSDATLDWRWTCWGFWSEEVLVPRLLHVNHLPLRHQSVLLSLAALCVHWIPLLHSYSLLAKLLPWRILSVGRFLLARVLFHRKIQSSKAHFFLPHSGVIVLWRSEVNRAATLSHTLCCTSHVLVWNILYIRTIHTYPCCWFSGPLPTIVQLSVVRSFFSSSDLGTTLFPAALPVYNPSFFHKNLFCRHGVWVSTWLQIRICWIV